MDGETAQFPTNYQRGRALILVSAQQQQRHMNKRDESRFNRCIGVLWLGAWSIAQRTSASRFGIFNHFQTDLSR
jgi:hypothetical protein